jgi:ubiquinone/menaquinone biosynthesis C-methylase UbiE
MARLAAEGARIVGLDLCEEMLARATGKTGLGGRVVLGDAARIPFAPGSADLILCSLAVGYFADLDAVFREIARVVCPAGQVLISDLHPDAIAAGWTRSFRHDGEVVEMRHYGHSIDDILSAARRASLRIDSQANASFDAPEAALFRDAGKPIPSIPALWIASWTRSI